MYIYMYIYIYIYIYVYAFFITRLKHMCNYYSPMHRTYCRKIEMVINT